VLLWVMAAFYLCRALGMSSWLPIIQEIVRPEDRGIYLSRQEWMRQVSIVLIAVACFIYLLGATGTTRFLHVIGVGVVAAAWSLWYLWRVPDVGSMAEPFDREYFRRAAAPLSDRVFRRYLGFSVSLRMILSAYTPFLVVFLREGLHLSPSGVIAINTVGSLGAIATLPWWGMWTDRVGAKPALGASIVGIAVSLLLWTLARPGPEWVWMGLPALSLMLGIFTGGMTVSMSKFELGFIPVRGRAHYVALNVTAAGLGSAIATMAAGWLLQALEGRHLRAGALTLDRYGIFFALMGALLALPFAVRRFLPEERARSLRALLSLEVRRRSRRVRRLFHRVTAEE
jgi:hypothetical protein